MASVSSEVNSQYKSNLRTQSAMFQNDLEQNSQNKKRFIYQPPGESEAASRMTVVMSYLKDTNVVEQMVKFSRSLARSSKLPYNPYPVFTQQCLPPAEKFHMYKEDDETIRSKLQNPLQSTTSKLIWGINGRTNIWGLKNLVHVVDPDYVEKFHEVIEQAIPSDVDVTEREGYSGQILTSLTSPVVLMGGFQPRPITLQIRLEYVIYGTDVSTGLDVFVKNVISDVKTALKDNSESKLLYVSLTTPSQEEGTRDGMTKWVKSKIEDQEEDFGTEILQTVQSQGNIKAHMVISFDDGSSQHVIRGSKEYILYFIEVSPGHDGEKLASFGEHPYQTLLEGVYLKKADAETYLLTMQRHPANPPRKPSRKMSRHASRNAGEMKISGGIKQKEDDLEEVIKQPIRLKYLKLIGDLLKVEDCFRLIDVALILILMDRGRYNIETLVDIYRFLQSTSCRFYSASCQNQVLVEFIQSIGLWKDSLSDSMLKKMYQQYKEDLLKTLNPLLHERPSHQTAYHCYFVYYLNELEALLKEETTLTKQIIRRFLQLGVFCESVQLQLTEDALKNCVHFNVKNFLTSCKEQLSPTSGGTNKKPAGTESNMKAEEVKDATNEGSVKSVLKHGAEDAEIMQQRFQYLAVEDAMKSNNHPVIMAKEGVLMQYLLNIRLDDVWGEYLRNIMDEPTPPPNPYPRLVTAMRKASLKMRLFGKRDQDIMRSVVSKQPQIADRKLNLYSLSECGVFGLKSALVIVDQDKLKKVIELADAISDQEPIKQKGKFQISSGVCLSGRTVFYGQMVPYVLKLELHHHFYIKGPLGSVSEVLQLFSKVVSEDIIALRGNSQRFVMAGVYVDDQKVTDVDEVSQVDLSTIIIDAASKKSILYLKLYHFIGWRYVAIGKHYRLHYLFVDNADDRHEAFFPENLSEEHLYVFLSKEEAMEYFQKCSEEQTEASKQKLMAQLDLDLSGNLTRREILPAYRCFLLKCLIGGQPLPLADIWRVFHSPAAQVEYVMSLAESLRDLVDSCFKCHLRKQPTPSPVLQNSKKKQKTEVPKKEPTFVGNINMQTLCLMVQGFTEKLSELLHEPSVLAPTSLITAINDKLKSIINFQSFSIAANPQTIIELEEIRHLLHPLLVSLADDVDSVCREPILQFLDSSSSAAGRATDM
ncbi:hypothetical protein HOLleu_09509 [Holothuria leucospilota]|uniref:Uncharacterized protein n=1 Tax=Holothuria leucospilota TaxID=206669 RepID=A0A9Q1HF05_HOLLE|nr:hypothetical protein HOLleu_09509 [Holothuria leucospilota]